MSKFGIGQPVRRVEDQRFITGQGRYTDDIDIAGQAYGYVVRSPEAHARIRSLDVAAAKAAPGVLAGDHRRRHRSQRRQPSALRRPAAQPGRHPGRQPAAARCSAPTASATSATTSPSWSPRRSRRPRTRPS